MVSIVPSAAFQRALRKLPPADQRIVLEALVALSEAFGQPHVHSGLSIRQLRRHVYEVRVGLDLRVGFTLVRSSLVIQTVGNHDHIRAWLKENA